MTADHEQTPPRSVVANLFGLPLVCAGLCLIAVCLLVPQAESNRRLAVERDQLQVDVAHAEAQLAVDGRFLAGAAGDPEVAERLAQRQLREIRGDATALPLTDGLPAITTAADMLRVPPPPPVSPYRPPAGILGDLTRTTHRQLLGLAGGLFLVGVGLILGPGEADARSEDAPATA